MSQYPQHPQYPQQPYPQYPGYPIAPKRFGPGQYAGIILVVLSIITLLMGGCFGLAAGMWNKVPDSPEKSQMSDQLGQLGFTPQAMFTFAAVMFGVYCLIAMVIGILLLRRLKPASYIGIGLGSLVCLYFAADAIFALSKGVVGGFLVAMLCLIIHAVLVLLMIAELKTSRLQPAPMPMYYPGYHPMQYGPMQYSQPMQGYYQQPTPPPNPTQPPQPPPSEPPQA